MEKDIYEKREYAFRVASKSSETAAERIFEQPVDVLCFGRSGIGKSTLLSALTNLPIETSSNLDHCTKQCQCYTSNQIVNGKMHTTRYWDTKGIDKWNEEDLSYFYNDLHKNKVSPLIVIYCSHGMGRVDSKIVRQILTYFYKENKIIIYVITNKFALSDEQHENQIAAGMNILRDITETHATLRYSPTTDIYPIHERALLCCVNSKQYISRGGYHQVEGIREIIDFIATQLTGEELIQFFFATMNNRDDWQKLKDKVSDKLGGAMKQIFKISLNILTTIFG